MKKNVLLGGWAGLAAALLMGILPALASRNENGNWLIEKWSERPTVGNRDRCVNYHLRVTRKGPPVSGAVLTDYRDASYTTNYGAAQPPPDAGGGTASSAAWNLPSPMNPGETFEAVVRVDTTGATDFGANFGSPGVSDVFDFPGDLYNYAPANYLQVPQERYTIGGYGHYDHVHITVTPRR